MAITLAVGFDNLPTAPANHFFADPIDGVDAPPHIARLIEDLPLAKEDAVGAVGVPADGGLDVTAAGELVLFPSRSRRACSGYL